MTRGLVFRNLIKVIRYSHWAKALIFHRYPSKELYYYQPSFPQVFQERYGNMMMANSENSTLKERYQNMTLSYSVLSFLGAITVL